MNKKELLEIDWKDDVPQVDCPHCGEMIAESTTDSGGNIQRMFKIKEKSKPFLYRYRFQVKESGEEEIDPFDWKTAVTGKCFNCNWPVKLCYFSSGLSSPKQHQAAPAPVIQRWKEQDCTLRCECGERIGLIDTMNDETLKQRRFFKPEYKPGGGRCWGRLSQHDKMVWKENLEHFIPVQNRDLHDGLPIGYDEHGLSISDWYDPSVHEESPYKPVLPQEIARHYLALRLRFHSTFREAAYRVSWSYYELTVKGSCPKCGIVHSFSPAFREDFLSRCVDMLEERRKQASKT